MEWEARVPSATGSMCDDNLIVTRPRIETGRAERVSGAKTGAEERAE